MKKIFTYPVWSTRKCLPLVSCGSAIVTGAVNPPAMNLRPTATSGVRNFVREGYVVKVAASGEFWLVRSVSELVAGVAVGTGVGPVPCGPAHPAMVAATAIMARRIRI
jgi:hypothetical protein